MSLPKYFDHTTREQEIYEKWESEQKFSPSMDTSKPSFYIPLPPPNATGTLHLGHATMLSIQDTLIRYHRLKGDNTLWLPGTDHAAIATESVVIKKIQEEEGIDDPRAELGREEVLDRIKEFVAGSQDTIRNQVRKMGSSIDWSRERYTMEPALNRIVEEVFVKMANDGLIYRGHRIVNWDPNLATTVSDDEVEYKEESTPFYTFQYGPFQISTARPETKFGDKYVVVHPDDKRYAEFKHGDTFEAEWINGKVTATVIKDKAIDPEFGTGAMTITPWHDVTDFEIAERHNLDKEQVIDFDGTLLPIAGEFEGMHIKEARAKIAKKLEDKGLLVSVDNDYVHQVAINDRGKGTIEPQIKEQWWVDVNKQAVKWDGKTMSLKEVMQDVVKTKKINILPEKFEKTYFNWIDNLQDWCISRQIWWGHRIPAYYKRDEHGIAETYIGLNPPTGEDWEQDPDTLDTWFSSALWTWSTLIDPELTKDNKLSLDEMLAMSKDMNTFHPANVLETGYDIIFFWVARMILMTTYVTGDIPFKNVYLHGLVRTKAGKKMSKSDPEGAIDPIRTIEEYGADALRLSMLIGQSPGNDMQLYPEKIQTNRNIINKIWNIAKFVLEQGDPADIELKSAEFDLADKWILSKFHRLLGNITENLEKFEVGKAADAIIEFTKSDFADWYIEFSKAAPSPARAGVLHYILQGLLQVLHPFIPYVTEEIWAHTGNTTDLITSVWPKPYEDFLDDAAEEQMAVLKDIITSTRNLKQEAGIKLKEQLTLHITPGSYTDLTTANHDLLIQMTQSLELKTATTELSTDDYRTAKIKDITIGLSLEDLKSHGAVTGPSAEELKAELERINGFIAALEKKLSNKNFTDNAPEQVIKNEQQKLADQKEKADHINQQLQS